jgi:hypothetical protein
MGKDAAILQLPDRGYTAHLAGREPNGQAATNYSR